jgi:murein DD-endopeptidase MepM/ murein hydrolase activator NlpD
MHARHLAALLSLALSGCYDSVDVIVVSDGGTASSGPPALTTGTTAAAPDSSSGELEPTTAAPTTAGEVTTTGLDLTTTGPGPTTLDPDSSSGDQTTGDLLDECPRLRVMVAPDPSLNVRPDPSTAQPPVASLPHGAIVDTVAAVQGESIEGDTLWYQIAAPAGYVSGVFVECTQDLPPPPPEGFYLPVACGMQVKCTQGNNGATSHSGVTKYAFDFGVGLNTPVHASAAGTVTNIYDETGPGDACYNGGGPECGPFGNLVIVAHGDGSTTLYKHLNEVHVTLGQQVPRGHVVGLSGSTGYSTGPHIHSMRMENCGANNCQSIPMEYADAGVPVTGQTVTSQNCP